MVQLHDAYNRSVFCTSMPHWLGDHCDVQYILVYCINPTYDIVFCTSAPTSLLGWPLLLVLTLSSFTQYQTRLSRVDNLASKPTICVCVLVAKPECEKNVLVGLLLGNWSNTGCDKLGLLGCHFEKKHFNLWENHNSPL